jgi:hypothetical protein
MGFYLQLAMTGVEMVVPIVLGSMLDARMGWGAWATLAGVILGMGGSLAHLLWILKRYDRPNQDRREQP